MPEIDWDGLLVRLCTLRSGGDLVVEEKIQSRDGAERLLFRSPLADLFFAAASDGPMRGGTDSLINSGSVKAARGSASTISRGTDSRMNSGRVRRVSGFFILLMRTAS